jgi:putative phosphoribosyl transferase
MVTIEVGPVYVDRTDAGKRLASKLAKHKADVVFGIPRGGVPVAIEVARKLGIALDLIVARKIPVPDTPEAGYGAVTAEGGVVLNEPLVSSLGLTPRQISQQSEDIKAEIRRRRLSYRDNIRPYPVKGKTALLVDDGLASGFTMLAAVKSLRKRDVGKIIAAVPVASGTAYEMVKPLVDDLICGILAYTRGFAVASFYQHWTDLTDEEVLHYLKLWKNSIDKNHEPRRRP